jgi:hypothetical protein
MRMKWAVHVANNGKKRNDYTSLVANLKGTNLEGLGAEG